MDNQSLTLIALFVLGGLCTVMWWLLRNKDSAQSDQIRTLFSKHDEDAEKLADLKLEIARQYYVKTELDPKFEKLEHTISEWFSLLGAKFDMLNGAVSEHIRKDLQR